MAGVILELLNIRKLCAFGIGILILQIIFFLIGGLIAPEPNTSEQILALKCLDDNPAQNMDKFFFSRPEKSNGSCKDVVEHVPLNADSRTNARQIVFMMQFPLPRSGIELDMTRWFQEIFGAIHLDIMYKHGASVADDAEITLDVHLGYRNKEDPPNAWKTLARSVEKRPLKCTLDRTEVEESYYDCEVVHLFSLGSCDYDYYLVNIRLPVDVKRNINTKIGLLKDIWLVEIHQNGGFTKVWFALKTFMFPFTLLALIFFYNRLRELPRNMNLLERTIMALGIVMSILNIPVEWLSLKFNLPIWLLVSDVRQGLFYTMLMCFWIIFTGEHMMDDTEKNKVTLYWKHLLIISLGGCCLFLFEIAERGVQLSNPFYSIWTTPVSASIGFALVVIASISAILYFLFLFVMLVRVGLQMRRKKSAIATMPEMRRRYYSGVIYRFCVFFGFTFICAALTVAFYIVSQVDEDSWKWGGDRIHYNSAFITGVYGMWNLYVFSLLILYAPSHKLTHGSSASEAARMLSDDLSSVAGSMHTAMELQAGGGSASRAKSPPQSRGDPTTTSVSEGMAFLQKAAHD